MTGAEFEVAAFLTGVLMQQVADGKAPDELRNLDHHQAAAIGKTLAPHVLAMSATAMQALLGAAERLDEIVRESPYQGLAEPEQQ